MRVRMINPRTGGIVLVHESRITEYESLGYTLDSPVIADVEAVEIPCATVKKQAKKSTKR